MWLVFLKYAHIAECGPLIKRIGNAKGKIKMAHQALLDIDRKELELIGSLSG